MLDYKEIKSGLTSNTLLIIKYHEVFIFIVIKAKNNVKNVGIKLCKVYWGGEHSPEGFLPNI